jgi:hypothetical protein
MSVRRPDREFSSRPLNDVVRAFQVDPSWYESHWYGAAEAPRPRRSMLARRPGAGLAAISFLVVAAVVWL